MRSGNFITPPLTELSRSPDPGRDCALGSVISLLMAVSFLSLGPSGLVLNFTGRLCRIFHLHPFEDTSKDVYERSYDYHCPVVCFDETPKQLIEETHSPTQAAPGHRKCYHYGHKRNGTRNLFIFTEPQGMETPGDA